MKKRIIYLIMTMIVCASINAQAQNRGWQRQDNRKQFSPELYMKTLNDFVAREANLNEEESAKFFPLLNEMLGKQHYLMEMNRRLIFKSRKDNSLTEKEYEDIVSKMAANDIESEKLEQAYNKKFHSVLSWKKIFAVKMALNRWQMEALNHFRPEGKNNQPFKPWGN